MGAHVSDHIWLDERSLAMHRLVARKIADRPALIEIARDNLRRWRRDANTSMSLREWEQILNKPLENVLALLTQRSERATRLRQSSPFAGILTEAERKAIYESFATRTRHWGGQPDHR